MQLVGEQIKGIRTALGMTQQQLAERTGFPQSMIANIENGKHENMGLLTIQKLAEALDCESLVQVSPRKSIKDTLDEQSTRIAQKIVSMSSGSAAIEMQFVSQKSRDEQIALLKKDLLNKHRSSLWQKI